MFTRLISLPLFILLGIVAMLPFYGSFMPFVEGSLWPVTSKVAIISVTTSGAGVDIVYTYTKYRLCELVGYSAKINGIDTLLVPVGESVGLSTRGLGPEAPRTWHLVAPNLNGAEIWILYRCNPLWLTATKVFP
jgi:hypothetical protein